MRDRTAIPLCASLLLFATAACSPPPEAPPVDQPPEPQATRLHDAVQAPLDKAAAVEEVIQDVDRQRRGQLDAGD